MVAQAGRTPPLAEVLWESGETRLVRAVALVLAGSLLLTLSAKVQVPFWPVPMTMQTFAVMVIGAAYGARLAAATVLVYLAQGALGLPVFAAGGGLVYLTGPTGGYLVGYVFAAAAIGWFAERGFDRRVSTAMAAFIVGDAILFAAGLAWLSVLVGVEGAVMAGLVPFLPAEVLKIALAAAVTVLIWRAVGDPRGG